MNDSLTSVLFSTLTEAAITVSGRASAAQQWIEREMRMDDRLPDIRAAVEREQHGAANGYGYRAAAR